MMTPEAAGAALAADPTFRLMSREEQEEEAARLLGGFNTPSDDPLDVALAIELAEAGEFAEALQRERDAITATGAGIEACRLNGGDGPSCGGAEPIAGNGRCMTCGAQRRTADVPCAHKPMCGNCERDIAECRADPCTVIYPVCRLCATDLPQEPATGVQGAPAPVAPLKTETAPTAAPAPILRHGVTNDPGASFLGRFKEATGATDRETSGMLGMSRATVQAYAGGRLPEKLDAKQVATLRTDIAERLLLLADLDRDLAVAVGEAD